MARGSSRSARTTSSWPRAASTPSCIASRPRPTGDTWGSRRLSGLPCSPRTPAIAFTDANALLWCDADVGRACCRDRSAAEVSAMPLTAPQWPYGREIPSLETMADLLACLIPESDREEARTLLVAEILARELR